LILLCDEGVDRPIVDALRSAGHDVQYIAESDPSITDEEVLELANGLGAVLVTLDKDFGELVFRQGRVTSGVLLLRLLGLSANEKNRLVGAAVEAHSSELPGSFAVLTQSGLRIRRRP
jgi:predicted nuclease of predicted toxin-antitoxin system